MTESSTNHYQMKVSDIEDTAQNIKLITLEEINNKEVFECLGGSNIVLDLPLKDKLHKNTYSIVRRTPNKTGYQIAVLKDENGRGGSKWIHEEMQLNTVLRVSTPGNMFPINISGRHHILFAGGIGITPMISYIEWFERYGGSWELHYASRGRKNCFYYEELLKKYTDKVNVYFTEDGNSCDIRSVLLNRPAGTNAYVCGPQSMISAFHDIGESLGWPDTALHSEAFKAAGGKEFTANLVKSNKVIKVESTETLLEAIEKNGVEVANICRGGGCGYCKVKVEKGTPEHRDFFLTDQEKEENKTIMVCVSRCKGDAIDLYI